MASCEVKYGIPVSDGKKVAQLICLGRKKYGTVIMVTQMCMKSEKVTCTAKHIVDEMWIQWRIEGGKEKGKENANDEEETTLLKVDEKVKGKGKDRLKEKDNKGKKEETRTCNHCGMKGHIEVNCWKNKAQKPPPKPPRPTRLMWPLHPASLLMPLVPIEQTRPMQSMQPRMLKWKLRQMRPRPITPMRLMSR